MRELELKIWLATKKELEKTGAYCCRSHQNTDSTKIIYTLDLRDEHTLMIIFNKVTLMTSITMKTKDGIKRWPVAKYFGQSYQDELLQLCENVEVQKA